MVIGEDVAASSTPDGGSAGWGDLPRTVAPLPFVTEHNISSAGRANNGEVRKRDSGDPPPPFREDQISSPQVRGPEPRLICL